MSLQGTLENIVSGSAKNATTYFITVASIHGGKPMVSKALLPFFEALWLSPILGGAVLIVYTTLLNVFQCRHAGAASILSISQLLQVVNPTLVSVHATELVNAVMVDRKNLVRNFAIQGLATFLVPKLVTTAVSPLHNLPELQMLGIGSAPEYVGVSGALYEAYCGGLP
jgi:hypothetical protein